LAEFSANVCYWITLFRLLAGTSANVCYWITLFCLFAGISANECSWITLVRHFAEFSATVDRTPLGVVALVVPRFPRLKEWMHAGIFFLMTGAALSQALDHDYGD
jgi:DoxX-like family